MYRIAIALAMLSSPALAQQQTLYQVAPGVSDGVLNIRQGPSASYALVAAIPAGEFVTAYRCVAPTPPSKADWCDVTYRGARGWASTTGLLPIAPGPQAQYLPPVQAAPAPQYAPAVQRSIVPTPPPSPYMSIDWVCTPSMVVTTDDRNPVKEILIHAEGSSGRLRRIIVTQVLLDGAQYDRGTQYANSFSLISDPEHDRFGWRGTYVRDATVVMQGEFITGNVYKETQWKAGAFAFSISTPCKAG